MNDTAILTAEFVPGVYRGMPFEQYLRTPALSASGAKHLLKTPAHFEYARSNPSDPSAAMRVGTAVHCGVLEPDHFTGRIACAPDVDRRTRIGKETWGQFVDANVGKTILPDDDYVRALGTINAVRAHPAASALLREAESEVTMFWRCPRWGINRKARLDATRGGIITDLKTCQDASSTGFAKDAAKYLYHVQAAQYVEAYRMSYALDPESYLFIAAESEEPHGVAVYSLPWDAIEAGARLLEIACERYRDCTASGIWPGYPTTIEPLTLPAWAYKEPQS